MPKSTSTAGNSNELTMRRGVVKGQLTRFVTFYTKFEDTNKQSTDDLVELQLRLDKTELLWSEFEDIQSKIEFIDQETKEASEQERYEFENKFFNIITKVKNYINAYSNSSSKSNTINQTTNGFNDIHLNQNIKLPQISLPTFEGTYETWLPFYDSFNSMIHSNKSLSNVQKFYYLRCSLKKEAEQVISALELTEANYEIAWDLLKSRFENKRLTVHNHVKSLFDIVPIAKESHTALRQLLDTLLKNLRALKNMGQPVEHWDTLIVYLMTSKFDSSSRREFEIYIADNSNLPSINTLTDFLTKRCNLLETIQSNKPVSYQVNQSSNKPYKSYKSSDQTMSYAAFTPYVCAYCKNQHNIYRCEEFLKLPITTRTSEVTRLKLCTNCLNSNHFYKDCKASNCKICSQKHNTLLHPHEQCAISTQSSSNTSQTNSNQSHEDNNIQETSVVSVHTSHMHTTQVLLSTALIHIFDKFGNIHECRTLLDSGSQSSFITQKLCNKLHLSCDKINMPISGISETKTIISSKTEVNIKSKYNNFNSNVTCLILPKITEYIPTTRIETSQLNIPADIKLADPKFNIPAEIDLLLGADIFWQLVGKRQIITNKNHPILQETEFGWIMSGSLTSPCNHNMRQSVQCHLSSNFDLQKQIEKFWILENTQHQSTLSNEEQECENHFTLHTTRNHQGRFVVKLPIRQDALELGESKQTASKRLHLLEKRFEKNPEMAIEYKRFMSEYEQLGHMTKTETEDDIHSKSIYYLPHHPVVKDTSITTKLRVVFDASAKTTTGVSLNDTMLVGPVIQDDLFSIVLRFRTHQLVLTGDITKMYRQIDVNTQDRNMQCILWRNNTNDSVSTYTLNTVTYGTAAAPFLAIRCLKQLALDDGEKYPLASQVLRNDFYVDDVLTGSATKKELIELQSQLTSLLSLGQFELRKWRTNDKQVLNHIKQEDVDSSVLALDKENTLKTLGLLWNSELDTLEYSVCLKNTSNHITKRTVLSMISQIFDPLGLIGPILILAKIIMQRLWELKTDWDASLPADIHDEWMHYYESIININKLKIPRKVIPTNHLKRLEVHGFSDASERAYGACIYIRCITNEDKYFTKLLCAKSRVAPLKTTSIPRLELCGALLLTQLITRIKTALSIQIDDVYLWTDSTIVLAWIATPSNQLKTFVANRISEIQDSTEASQWNHVSSQDNPADAISRGLDANQLIENKIWWNGPSWLCSDNSLWPTYSNKETYNHLNQEIKIVLVGTHQENAIFHRYSSWKKLYRVISWCRRFANNCLNRGNRLIGPLNVKELDAARISILKLVQEETFQLEKQDLRNQVLIHRSSKLLKLNPFLDEHDIIRVGGRLKHSNIAYNQKFPIVLPNKHVITEMIIREEHLNQLHAGPQSLLGYIRLQYWPLSGRAAVRRVTRKCIRCYRHKPISSEQMMGDLPKYRIEQTTRPFINCGVDYCGPMFIREGKRRGRIPIVKCYVAVFVCFTTKAVHLELVSDLTSEAFLSALRRFVSRRGKPLHIFSDNATNFVGVNKDLEDLYRFISNKKDTIMADLSNQGITWHFIPARSPHFGGLWEAAVKSVKHHLRRTTGNCKFTYEEYYTMLVQIEAILNSRPLIPMSTDPNDLSFLTPSHFIIGDSLLSIPNHDYTEIPSMKLSRWKQIEQVKQHFWSRWSKDYLCNLQQRSKWTHPADVIWKVGSLVLLRDENLPPNKWTLGRIVALHPGEDGLVRVVSVRASNGVFKRATAKVCLLPTQC